MSLDCFSPKTVQLFYHTSGANTARSAADWVSFTMRPRYGLPMTLEEHKG